MKLYRVDFHAAEDGALVAWEPNRRAADARLAEFRRDYGEAQGPEGVTRVNVPADKRGLVAWLNANLNTDNG